MRVLFATGSPARYMRPPQLGDQQIVCGPDWPDDIAPDGQVRSLATPVGEYDLSAVAARLPGDQQPDLVVCLVDASWRNLPRHLANFTCPRVLLVADTHHLTSPLLNMLRYLMAETYDRIVLLYDRHHAPIFHAAGVQNLFWFPGLTFPHGTAAIRKARAPGARAARIAFVGQAGQHHPRRARLLAALAARHLPVEQKALGQLDGLAFYGSSLLGFNASLNGDLNLRVFEILSSGAALLTDRLAPGSGLAQLFGEGRELLTYGSPDELAERAAHALAHPQETRAIGAAGAAWFDRIFNAERRRAAFQALAFDGTPVPEFAFASDEVTRVFFGGNTDRLVQAVMAYEGIQELHRTEETVRIAIDPAVPPDVNEIFATLPRIAFPPASTPGAADMAVFGREQAIQGVVVNAPRLWCWNAEEPDYDELAAAFGPSGFRLASRDVAVLCYDAAAASGVSATAALANAVAAAASCSKHILLVTDDPDSGGVAQYNHTILCSLARAGYRVSCLQTRADNPLVAEQQQLGITHHWLDYHTGRDFARTLTDATEALRLYQTDRPDLVIFSDCCPVSNLAAREAARRLDLPYIVVEGFVGAYLAENFAAQLPLLQAQYAAARAVVAVSQENLSLLRTLFGLAPDRGRVIHYGRPARFFAPRDPAVRARLRAEIKLPADAVVCFTAARLTAVKGFNFQLAALSQLATLPGAKHLHFVWAGDGDQRAALEQEIARLGLGKRITLLGHRWDVADWYDAADIFILPSQIEGMPLAIMEAMAKGLPVIATAVSGIPEELGETGKLLPHPAADAAGVVRGLVKTLALWAGNAGLRARDGERGRLRAEQMFREDLMIQRTLGVIDSFLSPHSTTNPEPTSSLLDRGRVLFEKGLLPEALELGRAELMREPSSLEARALLGEIALGYPDGAKTAAILFQQALEIAPDDLRLVVLMARADLALGELKKAENLLVRALAHVPHELHASLALARLREVSHQSVSAEQVLHSTALAHPGRVEPLQAMGDFLKRSGRLTEALSWHRRSVGGPATLPPRTGRPRVLFIAQHGPLWHNLDSVYRAFAADPAWEATVVAMPNSHPYFTTDEERNGIFDFLTRAGVPFVRWDRFELTAGCADIVFVPTPYETVRPPAWSSSALVRLGLRLAYVPYCFETGDDAVDYHNQFDQPLQRLAWAVFARSAAHQAKFARHCQVGAAHVIVTGHPKTDALRDLDAARDPALEAFAAGRKLVCWNPHFDVKPDGSPFGAGYSTFLRWWQFLPDEFARRPDMAFVIRPHPVFFASLEQRGVFTRAQLDAFVARCAAAGNIQIDRRPSYLPVFAASSAMLSDQSTFILEYPVTGKPMLYLRNPRAPAEATVVVGDYCPAAETEQEIVQFLDDVAAGRDPRAAERLAAYRASMHLPPQGVGTAIKQAIEQRLQVGAAAA